MMNAGAGVNGHASKSHATGSNSVGIQRKRRKLTLGVARKRPRPSLGIMAVAALVSMLALPVRAEAAPTDTPPAEQCVATGDCEVLFTYTGDIQEWVVPAGVTSATVSLAGGQGGTTPVGMGGGGGGNISAIVPVVAGQIFPVQVGGRPTGAPGGYGGGGKGFNGCNQPADFAAGGGGASQFGKISGDVVLIAGGGGGGGGHGYGSHSGDGGGGGSTGARGNTGEHVSGSFIGSDGGTGGYPGVTEADGTGHGGYIGRGGNGENRGVSGEPGELGLGGAGGGPDGDCYGGGGGGGGGGHYGGGGGGGGGAGFSAAHAKMTGGGGGGGGGGTNYASPTATVLSVTDGLHAGSGTVQINYRFAVEQTVTITSTPPDPAAIHTSYQVAATASSGLPVTISGAGACPTLNGDDIFFSEVGTCTITASQAGNEFFLPAQATQSVTVPGLPQPLAFAGYAPEHPTVGGESYHVRLISGDDQNPVRAVVTATGSCNNVDDAWVVVFTAPGPCVVSAVAPAYGNYAASEQVTRTFDVKAADPAVAFATTPPDDAVVGDTYRPTATGGAPDAGDIVITSNFPEYCTVDKSGIVTFLQAGTCTLSADQFSPTHDPTKHATQVITVGPAPTVPGGSSGGMFGSS